MHSHSSALLPTGSTIDPFMLLLLLLLLLPVLLRALMLMQNHLQLHAHAHINSCNSQVCRPPAAPLAP
jgi:hypothetical protein